METIVTLSESEIKTIRKIIQDVKADHASAECDNYIRDAYKYVERIPASIKNAIRDLKYREDEQDVLILRGFPKGEFTNMETPEHWQVVQPNNKATGIDFASVILSSILGYIFSWKSQQFGNFINDLIPIKGMENEQVGSSSATTLAWHNEDCFHPCMPDYICLYCLRNEEGVNTKLWSVRRLAQHKNHPYYKELFKPNYEFLVDVSHNQGLADDDNTMANLENQPLISSVLWGDESSPYLSFDPHFMRPLNDKAKQALEWLEEVINSDYSQCALQESDIIFFNNHRVTHGREAFSAKFDGQDRWLRRILITESLRKSIKERKVLKSHKI